MESYRTVKQETSAEFIEKRSKFIGYIKPVQTEEEAIALFRVSNRSIGTLRIMYMRIR